MLTEKKGDRPNILYVFAGEKAQGAEIVIERLMQFNQGNVNSTHLILSPGKYADDLLHAQKSYHINVFNDLKKLNRSSANVVLFYLKALRNYFTVSYYVFRYIKENNINIVHANTNVPSSYLLPLVCFSKLFLPSVKWYWTDHDLKYFSRLETVLSNLCARLYDHTFAVSNAVRLKYPPDYKKVVVLYNGLDLNYFKPDNVQRNKFRERLGLSEKLITIGIAANINPDKGQMDLINVFNRIHTGFPDTRLIMAGSYASHFPEYADQVKAAIKMNGNIMHAGFINDIAEFYNGCDIIINNSNKHRSESLGTTIYEAMACEKLVVASNTGGTPEIITDTIDGFLFETESLADLERTLIFIFNNYNSLNNVRIAARNKAKDKFDIFSMVKTYNSILQNH